MDGGEVDWYVQEGRISEVAAYCETDVVNTYRVWLVYELFRGTLRSKDLHLRGPSPHDRSTPRLPEELHPGAVCAVGCAGHRFRICAWSSLTRDQIALMQNDNVASSQFPGLHELGVEPTPVDAVLDEVGRRAAASGLR
jgi:hypothetical protein